MTLLLMMGMNWGSVLVNQGSERVFLLRIPEYVLSDSRVQKSIHSGLTCTLMFDLRANDAFRKTGLVTVRFEPWDEIFLVEIVVDGQKHNPQTVTSNKDLIAWLTQVGFRIHTGDQVIQSISVNLKLVPFSEKEQEDAQRWFTKDLNNDRGSLSTVADYVLASSIGRKSACQFSWEVDLAP